MGSPRPPHSPPPQPRRDEGPVGIDREVHQRPLGEEQVVRIPVSPVLPDRVLDALPGIGVFQLHGGNGKPVDEERHVHRQPRVPEAEVQLPRHRQHVPVVLGQRVGRQGVPRSPVGQVDQHPPVLDPLPQHIEHPARVDLGSDPLRELPHRRVLISAMQLKKPVPLLHLRLADKLPQRPGVQAKLGAEQSRSLRPPPLEQLILNPILKRPLAKRSRTHTEIPPVTA